MARGGLLVSGIVAVLMVGAAPVVADETAHPWSVAPGVGLVDLEQTGTSPAISVELERIFATGLSFGARALYTRDDSDFETLDTFYGNLFARLRWSRTTIRPFVEAGFGRYEFEHDSKTGWFAGLGVDLPWAERRSVLVAGRYHSVDRGQFDELLDFVEIQASVRFTF